LTKEDVENTYETLTQEFLEKCGFVYHKGATWDKNWWIYIRPLELDKDDITPQKIADAVIKITDEITKAYHEAKSS